VPNRKNSQTRPACDPIAAERMDELLRYLPLLEDMGEDAVVKYGGGERMPDGAITMRYPIYRHEVERFFEFAAQPCWSDDGYDPEKAGDMLEDADLVASADIEQVRTMLTFCVRGERFCQGFWARLITSGGLTALLKRLQTLRQEIA